MSTTRQDWTSSSLGERIEYICQLKGWSLNKLGEESGIASGPMSRLARHTERVAASPDTMERIADATGVSIVWLMLGRGPVYTTPQRVGMLRAHPDWSTALADAKKRQRGIPEEFWNMAGDAVLNPPYLDWQFIVGLVREMYSSYQRSLETEEAPPSGTDGRSTPRRSPKK